MGPALHGLVVRDGAIRVGLAVLLDILSGQLITRQYISLIKQKPFQVYGWLSTILVHQVPGATLSLLSHLVPHLILDYSL